MAKEAGKVRRRERKNITSGMAHVNSTFNNTMVTITDAQGNAISWSSAGAQGFKGSRQRKSVAYKFHIHLQQIHIAGRCLEICHEGMVAENQGNIL